MDRDFSEIDFNGVSLLKGGNINFLAKDKTYEQLTIGGALMETKNGVLNYKIPYGKYDKIGRLISNHLNDSITTKIRGSESGAEILIGDIDELDMKFYSGEKESSYKEFLEYKGENECAIILKCIYVTVSKRVIVSIIPRVMIFNPDKYIIKNLQLKILELEKENQELKRGQESKKNK